MTRNKCPLQRTQPTALLHNTETREAPFHSNREINVVKNFNQVKSAIIQYDNGAQSATETIAVLERLTGKRSVNLIGISTNLHKIWMAYAMPCHHKVCGASDQLDGIVDSYKIGQCATTLNPEVQSRFLLENCSHLPPICKIAVDFDLTVTNGIG